MEKITTLFECNCKVKITQLREQYMIIMNRCSACRKEESGFYANLLRETREQLRQKLEELKNEQK